MSVLKKFIDLAAAASVLFTDVLALADGVTSVTKKVTVSQLALMAGLAVYFGDGSDGDVVVNGPVTLTRDMYYNSLTVQAGAAINTAQFRIYVKTYLDITAAPAGAFVLNGNAGANAVVNALGAAGALFSGQTPLPQQLTAQLGKNGGTTTGTAGVGTGGSTITCYGGRGGSGGTGGNGSSGNGGAAGISSSATLNGTVRNAANSIDYSGSGYNGSIGGSSGGSGGGDGTAGGGSGGGGQGGGVIYIAAQEIRRSAANVNAGIFQAKGAAGGNGGLPAGGSRGGGAGSGGGGGGWIYILAGVLTGTAQTNALDVSSGKGGDGSPGTGSGTAGTGGQAGYCGVAQVIELSTATITVNDMRATGGNAAAGTTGGAATTAQANL